jgi:A/G-specific adenine glycosylase
MGTDPSLAIAPEPVHQALIAWYRAHGRDLPWRHTRDPYAILVAEIMLQQTQVDRVAPKYRAFLERFPTLGDLAAASVADAITAWAGLGYNQRAVRLHQIARIAVARHGGKLPDTLEELLRLPGIGRYTAGAIACFALGQAVATVDTNIRRVLVRVFAGALSEDAARFERPAEALALAEAALPDDAEQAYDWNQALMDLGATICGARAPLCERCPLSALCLTAGQLRQRTLFPTGAALPQLRAAESPAAYKISKAGVPFARTTRYYRGRVVAALRSASALTVPELAAAMAPDAPGDEVWLRDLVAGLVRDGLAAWADPDQTLLTLPR